MNGLLLFGILIVNFMELCFLAAVYGRGKDDVSEKN